MPMSKTEYKLFTAKVDEPLLAAFKRACDSQDKSASQEVRAFMRVYVEKHGQGDLFAFNKNK